MSMKSVAKHTVADPIIRLLPILLAACLAGCSTLDVGYDFNPQTQFEKYRTYSWIPTGHAGLLDPTDPVLSSPLTGQKIHAAVEKQMATNGFIRTAEGEHPDFYVAYHVMTREKVALEDDWDTGFRPWNVYRGPRFGAYSYTEGTLVLDFIDRKTDQLFWRGTATDVIERPEISQKDVAKAVDKILEKYPPKPSEIKDEVS